MQIPNEKNNSKTYRSGKRKVKLTTEIKNMESDRFEEFELGQERIGYYQMSFRIGHSCMFGRMGFN